MRERLDKRRLPRSGGMGTPRAVVFGVVLGALLGLGIRSTPAAASLAWSSAKPIDHSPPFVKGATLQGVSCPSASRCVAVDEDGNVSSTTDPTGGASGLEGRQGPRGRPIVQRRRLSIGQRCAPRWTRRATWSPRPARPVAVGGGGSAKVHGGNLDGCLVRLAVSVRGGGGEGPRADVEAPHPGAQGVEARRTSTWVARSLTAVSCASSSLCVAVANGGQVVSSTHPTGGAVGLEGRATVQGANSLTAVSCPSSRLCVAVDGDQRVASSTRPTRAGQGLEGHQAWTSSARCAPSRAPRSSSVRR